MKKDFKKWHKEKECIHKGLYYFKFSYKRGKFTSAILSQVRIIDSKRLFYKIGYIRKKDFKEMKKRLISILK